MAVFSADLRQNFDHTPLINDPLPGSITEYHQIVGSAYR
jgi:hypothetical protein